MAKKQTTKDKSNSEGVSISSKEIIDNEEIQEEAIDSIDKDVDGNPGNFYRARAQITENELKDTPPGFNLMPGMKVSGKFKVGQRRLITYFIYPLIRTLGNSFAEP